MNEHWNGGVFYKSQISSSVYVVQHDRDTNYLAQSFTSALWYSNFDHPT